MVPSLRQAFNQAFTKEKYASFLSDLNRPYPGAIEFRVAETPVFIDRGFASKVLEACEHIVDVICDPGYRSLTSRSIPDRDRVADEKGPCSMIAFDFGICENEIGEPEPQLIELQGFPTLFGFQVYYPEVLRKHFPVPENYQQYLGHYDQTSYLRDLGEIILGGEDPQEVILLEIRPHEQKTRIDFYCTRDYLGIEPVCITELIREGDKLYYINKSTGLKTPVKRIYNRVIFDDLHAQENNLGTFTDIRQSLDVKWIPHPNWFYRISKFSLPLLRHPYVPATYYLSELKQVPADLENYVLKPLYSFAGQGVLIDVSEKDLENITDPENWILQRKVRYADIIQTPDIPAKAEIRIMYLWKEGWDRPRPAINLARLSKGKMIGVRYNQDKEWVGGSVAFVER